MKRLDRMPTYIHMTMAFMGGLWGAYSVVQWTNLGKCFPVLFGICTFSILEQTQQERSALCGYHC